MAIFKGNLSGSAGTGVQGLPVLGRHLIYSRRDPPAPRLEERSLFGANGGRLFVLGQCGLVLTTGWAALQLQKTFGHT